MRCEVWWNSLDSNQDLPVFSRTLCPLSYRSMGAGAESNCPSAVTTRRAFATPTRTSIPQTKAGTPHGVPAASNRAFQPRGGPHKSRSWPVSGRGPRKLAWIPRFDMTLLSASTLLRSVTQEYPAQLDVSTVFLTRQYINAYTAQRLQKFFGRTRHVWMVEKQLRYERRAPKGAPKGSGARERPVRGAASPRARRAA